MSPEKIEKIYKKAVLADLEGLDFLSRFSYEYMAKAYNGIGPSCMSEKHRKKLTKWLSLFEPACLIHDMRFELSDGTRFSYNFANMEFRENCKKLVFDKYRWFDWKRYRAWFVAEVLYAAVCSQTGWNIWRDAYGDKLQNSDNLS